jgi:HlyD family secretion protein
MKRKRKRIIWISIFIAVVIAGAAGALYFTTDPETWRQTLVQVERQILVPMDLAELETDGVVASGFIEAEETDLAPELYGRVVAVLVAEGDVIEAGETVARLDGTVLDAQIEMSRARMEIAEAELAQVRAGIRAEQIQQAEIALAQAQVIRDGAYQTWQDAIAMREATQEIDIQITQARTQVEIAEIVLIQATALKDAAVIAHDSLDDAWETMTDMKEQWEGIPEPLRPPKPAANIQLDVYLIPNDYWKAWVGVNTAKAGLEGVQAVLSNLYAMRNHAQDLNAQVDAASAQYETSKAVVQQAQAQLDVMQAGATEEEIAVAEAHVKQARAALDTLLSQRDKLTITTSVSGLVLNLNIHTGELAAPGATLLTLGDLDKVTLTVYVPEDELGQVNIGQEIVVEVDSYPDRTFTGTVLAIANSAEFTPRNVQTREERVNMVFAVDISIPNSDHVLKPGLPADAVFVAAE